MNRTEKYLKAIATGQKTDLPKAITKMDRQLKAIAEHGLGGEVNISDNVAWQGYFANGQKNNGNDLAMLDVVMDLGENREGINGDITVNYELYSNDNNIEQLSSRLFFNNSSTGGNVTGGNNLATDKLFNFKLGYNNYSFTREAYTNKTYRYLHCLISVKCKDQTQLCNFYVKNVSVSIGSTILKKMETVEPKFYAAVPGSTVTKVNKIDSKMVDYATVESLIQSPLYRKKWLVIGDSITENNFRTTLHYHDYIKELTGCTIINDGKSGTGYVTAYQEGNLDYKPISTRVGTYTYTDGDLDIISVFAGTNDWGRLTNALGKLGDSTDETIYGGIESTITQLLAKYPNKIIFTITPLPRQTSYKSGMNNSTGYSLEDVAKAVKEVSEKYSIPCLDLFHSSGLRPWIDSNNETFFKATGKEKDGLHPNEAGHKRITPIILKFLESLVY